MAGIDEHNDALGIPAEDAIRTARASGTFKNLNRVGARVDRVAGQPER